MGNFIVVCDVDAMVATFDLARVELAGEDGDVGVGSVASWSMLCKTGTVCIRVADPHFNLDHIYARTILTHVCLLLLAYLSLALNQLLSLCPIPLITPLLGAIEI